MDTEKALFDRPTVVGSPSILPRLKIIPAKKSTDSNSDRYGQNLSWDPATDPTNAISPKETASPAHILGGPDTENAHNAGPATKVVAQTTMISVSIPGFKYGSPINPNIEVENQIKIEVKHRPKAITSL